jgi:hypothetical protein
LGQLGDWWETYVVGQKPPDIDGGSAWKVYLRKRFPQDILPIKDTDDDTLVLVNNYKSIRQIIEEYTALGNELENQLKMKIGAHEGIKGEFGKVTWKKTKDSPQADWEAVCHDLFMRDKLDVKAYAETLKTFTTVKIGTRRFLFSPKKGWRYGNTEQIGTAGPAQLGPATSDPPTGDGEHGPGGASQGADRSALHHGRTAPTGPRRGTPKTPEGV